jgi:hypothetical protein
MPIHHFLFEPSSKTLSLRTKFWRISVCLTLSVRKSLWFYTSLHAPTDFIISVDSALAFSFVYLTVSEYQSGRPLWSKVPGYIIRCQFYIFFLPFASFCDRCFSLVLNFLQIPTQAAMLKTAFNGQKSDK